MPLLRLLLFLLLLSFGEFRPKLIIPSPPLIIRATITTTTAGIIIVTRDLIVIIIIAIFFLFAKKQRVRVVLLKRAVRNRRRPPLRHPHALQHIRRQRTLQLFPRLVQRLTIAKHLVLRFILRQKFRQLLPVFLQRLPYPRYLAHLRREFQKPSNQRFVRRKRGDEEYHRPGEFWKRIWGR